MTVTTIGTLLLTCDRYGSEGWDAGHMEYHQEAVVYDPRRWGELRLALMRRGWSDLPETFPVASPGSTERPCWRDDAGQMRSDYDYRMEGRCPGHSRSKREAEQREDLRAMAMWEDVRRLTGPQAILAVTHSIWIEGSYWVTPLYYGALPEGYAWCDTLAAALRADVSDTYRYDRFPTGAPIGRTTRAAREALQAAVSKGRVTYDEAGRILLDGALCPEGALMLTTASMLAAQLATGERE